MRNLPTGFKILSLFLNLPTGLPIADILTYSCKPGGKIPVSCTQSALLYSNRDSNLQRPTGSWPKSLIRENVTWGKSRKGVSELTCLGVAFTLPLPPRGGGGGSFLFLFISFLVYSQSVQNSISPDGAEDFNGINQTLSLSLISVIRIISLSCCLLPSPHFFSKAAPQARRQFMSSYTYKIKTCYQIHPTSFPPCSRGWLSGLDLS